MRQSARSIVTRLPTAVPLTAEDVVVKVRVGGVAVVKPVKVRIAGSAVTAVGVKRATS